MNRKIAFEILGLRPGASPARVKKAFRDLAKQYHPDRNPREKAPAARLERMQQINQAFHFLAPLLASATSTAQHKEAAQSQFSSREKREKEEETSPRFWDFFKILGKELKFKFYKKRGPRTKPRAKDHLRPKIYRGASRGNAVRFDTILNTLHPGVSKGRKSRNSGRISLAYPTNSQVNPHGNFMKYMALKRKIDARRSRDQNHGWVEKIEPVTRVNPVGGNTEF